MVEKNVQDSRRRVWIEAAHQRFSNFTELNVWLDARCRTLWRETRNPDYHELTLADMLEHEHPHLMPMPSPIRWLHRSAGQGVLHLSDHDTA